MASANPQGKGLVPLLEHWRASQPSVIRARTSREVLRDYLVTSLVISADFHFKPRPGVSYFLYLSNGHWQLSLVSPQEWRNRAPGPCLGRCVLQRDMTWQLMLAEDIGSDRELVEGLSAFQRAFLEWLDQDGTLEDHLPSYARSLPYYRRLLASGMASSLKHSMERSGLNLRQSREWLSAGDVPALVG